MCEVGRGHRAACGSSCEGLARIGRTEGISYEREYGMLAVITHGPGGIAVNVDGVVRRYANVEYLAEALAQEMFRANQLEASLNEQSAERHKEQKALVAMPADTEKTCEERVRLIQVHPDNQDGDRDRQSR